MDKVLIADGDAQLLLILRETLNKYKNKFEVVTVKDGLAAIKALQKQHFSLVVLDIQMPKINGLVLLSYMSKNFPKVPCIIMSANVTPELKKRLTQKSSCFIEKPFKIAVLADTIMTALGQQETVGGTLNGVSVGGFLKLIEMEYITCLCEINSKNGEKGFLLFEAGALYDAYYGTMRGEEAAVNLIKMSGVTIKFRKPPKKKGPRRILRRFSTLVREAARSGPVLSG